MAVARIVWWKFKEGRRDEGVNKIESFLNEIKANPGYSGFFLFLSMNNNDRATVVSIWENEEAMTNAEKTQYPKVVDAVSDLLAEPPQVVRQHLRIADMPKIYA